MLLLNKFALLIKNYRNLNRQITPNGFDLTVEKIFEFEDAGSIDCSNNKREVSKTKEIRWNNNWLYLSKDFYKVRANEILKIPLNLVALARPRSSLSRSGVAVDTGVWDAGFEGKSEFLLIVGNKNGFRIKKNSRIIQLIFIKTNKVEKGYNGIYNLIQ